MRLGFVIALGAGLFSAAAAFAQQNVLHERSPTGRSATPPATNALAAVVSAKGVVIRGHLGVAAFPITQFAGAYAVLFTKDVSKCVYQATLGGTDSTGIVFPGFITVNALSGSSNGVYVNTYDSAGKPTGSSFHLTVNC